MAAAPLYKGNLMSESEIRSQIEIVIGRIQAEHLGDATVRESTLTFLRDVLAALDNKQITAEDAYSVARRAIFAFRKNEPVPAGHS